MHIIKPLRLFIVGILLATQLLLSSCGGPASAYIYAGLGFVASAGAQVVIEAIFSKGTEVLSTLLAPKASTITSAAAPIVLNCPATAGICLSFENKQVGTTKIHYGVDQGYEFQGASITDGGSYEVKSVGKVLELTYVGTLKVMLKLKEGLSATGNSQAVTQEAAIVPDIAAKPAPIFNVGGSPRQAPNGFLYYENYNRGGIFASLTYPTNWIKTKETNTEVEFNSADGRFWYRVNWFDAPNMNVNQVNHQWIQKIKTYYPSLALTGTDITIANFCDHKWYGNSFLGSQLSIATYVTPHNNRGYAITIGSPTSPNDELYLYMYKQIFEQMNNSIALF